MRLTKVEIRRVVLPMVRSFETGFGTIDEKETIITKLYTSDGLVGYGESSATIAPIYNHETSYSCFYVQENYIAPQVVGKNFETVEDFKDAYSNIVGHPIARTGMECAFWHLIAQRDNKSLKQLFGGVKDEIPVGEGVGISASTKQTLTDVKRIVDAGYSRVKVKIAPGRDLEILHAVRARFPGIPLTVDANGSYRYDRDVEILRAFDQFNLGMLEQPFASDDICGHARLHRQIKTPICLDESIESLNDAHTAVGLDACQVINIKPGRVGGMLESIAIHDLAAQHDISVWCGGMGETGIGRAFNIAFASKANCRYPADMSPYSFFYKEDLVEDSFVVKDNGCIDVRTTPGLGYRVNDKSIEALTTKKVIVKS
ncbi:MAG TPA: o-succinylbenzoate synthase [Candidatus Saccharimonadales bacterium]|nr:o-succinylbenzoate synthase [Candidatus Saccharimonadales bacterium]